MIRIVVELLVLLCIIGGVLYLARQFDRQRPGNRALLAPPDATWRAVHHGTADERTEIQLVLLQVPDTVWDRRTFGSIDNGDPDYDRLLFNGLEDARARAALLNQLRDPA